MVDLLLVTGFGFLGGIVRVLLGWAKNYEHGFVPQRIVFPLILASLSGALAAVLIADDPKLAVIAGLAGADLIDALWKGLTRKAAGGLYAQGVVPVWISGRQMGMYNYMKRKGPITAKKYAERAEVSRTTALRDLRDLMRAGYVKQLGSGRSSKYKAVKPKK